MDGYHGSTNVSSTRHPGELKMDERVRLGVEKAGAGESRVQERGDKSQGREEVRRIG